MKKILAFAMALLLLSGLIGTGAVAEGKEVTIGWAYDAATFDPQNANADSEYEILNLVGEPLLREVGGFIQPGIAQSWDVSADGLVYTFHLRQSVYSNGTPVTAQDFVYSLLRLIDPVYIKADAVNFLKNAAEYTAGTCTAADVGVKALDDYTLELTLAATSSELLYTLAGYSFVPMNKDFTDGLAIAYGSEAANVLTNGAFTITEWAHESKIVIEKNPNYWNADAIKLDKITYVIGAVRDVGVDMMLSGELDGFNCMDRDQLATLTAANFPAITFSAGYQFINMNQGGGSDETAPYMSNTNFRLALSYALDREAIVAIAGGGTATTRVACQNDVGVNGSFQDEYPLNGWPSKADPAKAKEYLALALQELGVTIDALPTFSMLLYDSPKGAAVLQAAQDMFLTTLGIKCALDPQPIQQMMEKAMNGDWDFWWGGHAFKQPDFLTEIMSQYSSANPNNLTGYSNADFDKYYAQASQALDTKVRKDALFELEKIFCNQAISLIVRWNEEYFISIPELTGVICNGWSSLLYADLKQ
jgi:oligopeptide transport system substrate-binding protein